MSQNTAICPILKHGLNNAPRIFFGFPGPLIGSCEPGETAESLTRCQAVLFHLSVCHQSSATCPFRTPHSCPKPESIATFFRYTAGAWISLVNETMGIGDRTFDSVTASEVSTVKSSSNRTLFPFAILFCSAKPVWYRLE